MKTRQKSRDASGILLVCLMWMLSLSSSLHAQTWNINGNVTDEQGEPIIGANVVIQGTGTGTITDVEGNFKLASVTKGGGNGDKFHWVYIQDIAGERRIIVKDYTERR